MWFPVAVNQDPARGFTRWGSVVYWRYLRDQFSMTSSTSCDAPAPASEGLRPHYRRDLLRLLYAVTAGALVAFAALQFHNGKPVLAGLELLASVLLLTGYIRLARCRHLRAWTYGYLIPLFAFFNYVIIMPQASVASFVWVLMMPVLAYLLLGRQRGLVLSVPFMAAGCVSYTYYLGSQHSTGVAVDLLNMLLCAGLMLVFIHLFEQRREAAEGQLLALTQVDPLTGLVNHQRFRDSLARTLSECQRSNSPCALVLLDIDGFQALQAQQGLAFSNRLVAAVTEVLTRRLRSTDVIGRLGDGSFGLVLRDLQRTDAEQLTASLQTQVAALRLARDDGAFSPALAVGLAHSDRDGHQADGLVRSASRRLQTGGDVIDANGHG